MESSALFIGEEDLRAIKLPTTLIAKPKKLKEKMRHMERLESDNCLMGKRHGRDKGQMKDKEEEMRNIFKLPAMKDASRSVQPVKIYLGLLDGSNNANANKGIKNPNKRELFTLKGDQI